MIPNPNFFIGIPRLQNPVPNILRHGNGNYVHDEEIDGGGKERSLHHSCPSCQKGTCSK